MPEEIFENNNIRAWVNHDNDKILSISYYRSGGTAAYYTPGNSEWEHTCKTVRDINPDKFDAMFCNKK